MNKKQLEKLKEEIAQQTLEAKVLEARLLILLKAALGYGYGTKIGPKEIITYLNNQASFVEREANRAANLYEAEFTTHFSYAIYSTIPGTQPTRIAGIPATVAADALRLLATELRAITECARKVKKFSEQL